MKVLTGPILVLSLSLIATVALAGESRQDKQARLDAACEAARQEKIAPLRKQVIEGCVTNKELPDRAECERFYADYGERMGSRPAMFYELPECVTAFEFLQGDGS